MKKLGLFTIMKRIFKSIIQYETGSDDVIKWK